MDRKDLLVLHYILDSSNFITQISLAAKSFVFGGSEDDSEEYNDLRKFLPEWSQDSLISIPSKSPGKYTYIDLSANDPHAFLSELIISGRNEEEISPILIDKLASLTSPFLGKDLLCFYNKVL